MGIDKKGMVDMMSDMNQNSFCPKCGAIMQNGCCISCGYEININKDIEKYEMKEMQNTFNIQQDIQAPLYGLDTNINQESKKKSQAGFYIGIGFGCIVFAISTIYGCASFVKFIKTGLHFNIDQYVSQNGQDDAITPELEIPDTIIPLPDDGIDPLPHQDPEIREDESWLSLLKEQDERDNPFLEAGFTSHMGTNHKNVSRTSFQGNYYENICDSIDESVPYTIQRKYYSCISEDNSVSIQVSCVELEGALPNIDALNQAIFDKTMFLARSYLTYFSDYTAEDSINIMVDSYITYNDESTMSIVLDEYYKLEQKVNIDLYCINADLDTGMLLNNGTILSLDSQFVQEFLSRSEKQNGENAALSQMESIDVLNSLENEYNNIIFYTPLGIELGINYNLNGSTGWLTVTYEDYLKYLNHI